jgi:zinc protease
VSDLSVFVETSRKIPVVTFAVGFRVGSARDPQGKEGLARVTSRLFRRGTKGLGALQVEEAIDRLGAEFGADAGPSSSSAHGECITRNVGPFVELMSRLIGEPAFEKEELDRLVREAQAEIVEARDSDRGLASRAFRKTLFAGHPYARRVAGTIASLGSLDVESVRAAYAETFTRANAVVAVSGDVTESDARALAEQLLSRLPAGKKTPDPVTDPTGPKGRHLVIVDKAERTQTQLVVGALGSSAHDPDHFAWIVGNTAFGGTFTSRLMQEVRAKRGWSYGASSRVGFDRHREAFTMWTAPAAKDTPACLALELELLGELREKGVTEEETEFAKNYLERSHAFEIDTAKKRVHLPFEEALYDLPSGYHTRYTEKIRAVTKKDIDAALRERIKFDDLVVGAVITNAETGEALAKAIPSLASTTVLPYDFE